MRGEILPKARIMDWTAFETRLVQIGDSKITDYPGAEEGKAQHIRAWLVCPGKANFDRIAVPPEDLAAQWVIATPGGGEAAGTHDAESLLLSFDAMWPNGESLFQETACRSFSAGPYPHLEATAVTLLCFVRNHLPETRNNLPNSVADLHVYIGLKHRLDNWIEAFVDAMIAEGAIPTRLGISDQRIQRALHRLDSWPLDLPLNRQLVAREAGVTVPQLDRLFNAQLHLTPSRYFDGRRIANAKRSLCAAEITIKAIASRLGFHSEAHFSHWFKQHEQACPRSFRQAHVGRGCQYASGAA